MSEDSPHTPAITYVQFLAPGLCAAGTYVIHKNSAPSRLRKAKEFLEEVNKLVVKMKEDPENIQWINSNFDGKFNDIEQELARIDRIYKRSYLHVETANFRERYWLWGRLVQSLDRLVAEISLLHSDTMRTSLLKEEDDGSDATAEGRQHGSEQGAEIATETQVPSIDAGSVSSRAMNMLRDGLRTLLEWLPVVSASSYPTTLPQFRETTEIPLLETSDTRQQLDEALDAYPSTDDASNDILVCPAPTNADSTGSVAFAELGFANQSMPELSDFSSTDSPIRARNHTL